MNCTDLIFVLLLAVYHHESSTVFSEVQIFFTENLTVRVTRRTTLLLQFKCSKSKVLRKK